MGRPGVLNPKVQKPAGRQIALGVWANGGQPKVIQNGLRASQPDRYREVGSGKFAEIDTDECLNADKVKTASPHHRFLIAIHSPSGVVETGLLMWLWRKLSKTRL